MSSQSEVIRQNVFIRQVLAGAHRFDKQIYIPFLPDQMIVKYIHYNTPTGDVVPESNTLAYCYSTLVNDIIGSFAANTLPASINATYDLKRRQINGNYSFETRDINNAADSRTGDLVIFLEFVQYKNAIENKPHFAQ